MGKELEDIDSSGNLGHLISTLAQQAWQQCYAAKSKHHIPCYASPKMPLQTPDNQPSLTPRFVSQQSAVVPKGGLRALSRQPVSGARRPSAPFPPAACCVDISTCSACHFKSPSTTSGLHKSAAQRVHTQQVPPPAHHPRGELSGRRGTHGNTPCRLNRRACPLRT